MNYRPAEGATYPLVFLFDFLYGLGLALQARVGSVDAEELVAFLARHGGGEHGRGFGIACLSRRVEAIIGAVVVVPLIHGNLPRHPSLNAHLHREEREYLTHSHTKS